MNPDSQLDICHAERGCSVSTPSPLFMAIDDVDKELCTQRETISQLMNKLTGLLPIKPTKELACAEKMIDEPAQSPVIERVKALRQVARKNNELLAELLRELEI